MLSLPASLQGLLETAAHSQGVSDLRPSLIFRKVVVRYLPTGRDKMAWLPNLSTG